jgi:poly(ADP-ribose) glycohydrolase
MCVLEEIRFVLCPECLVARLFCPRMSRDHAIALHGIERFSRYTGYGRGFRWGGDYRDPAPLDDAGRRSTVLLAMDALCWVGRSTADQFNRENIRRDLHKAYTAFNVKIREGSPVATGNWGCGAFRGDKHLKFLIQAMAAGGAARPLVYYCCGDREFVDQIVGLSARLRDKRVTVSWLLKVVESFKEELLYGGERELGVSLFAHVMNELIA